MGRSAHDAGIMRLRSAVLDNGLEVLIREVHTAPLVSVWCWYKVGSKDETPGLSGVSHWVEHMNFKGTKNIPRDQVKGLIERFGGSWNGYTWIDQTTYMQTAAREGLNQMLFIEAERMANCLYEPEDCESERSVIISELKGGENDPEQLLDVEVVSTAFKAHPYRHPTIGWLEDLQSMSRDDLYGYYRRFYTPTNASLVVVGDIDTNDVLSRAQHYFGAIPAQPAPARVRSREPEQLGERRVTLEREGTTAYLKVAYHAPAIDSPDFFAMLVLDAVLTGAKGLNLWSSFQKPPPQRKARLYRRLVERQLASAVSGALVPTAHPFLYGVSATASEGVPLSVLESDLLEEVDRVRDESVTASEIERAKRQLRARFVFENESVTNVAHQLGFFQVVADVNVYLTLAERVEAVTPELVAHAAGKYFAPSNRTIGRFQPTEPQHP